MPSLERPHVPSQDPPPCDERHTRVHGRTLPRTPLLTIFELLCLLQMVELQGEVEEVVTERDEALERVSLIEEGIAQLQNG